MPTEQLKETKEVMILAMDVATDLQGSFQLLPNLTIAATHPVRMASSQGCWQFLWLHRELWNMTASSSSPGNGTFNILLLTYLRLLSKMAQIMIVSGPARHSDPRRWCEPGFFAKEFDTSTLVTRRNTAT